MSYRSITITVTNNTGQDFNVNVPSPNHGYWSSNYPDVIKNGTSATAECQSHDGALIGVTGTVNITGATTGGAFNFNFNKPFGSAQTTLDVNCPAGYTDVISGDLQGHNSTVTITYSN